MVARNTKSGSASPYSGVHLELDNKALKAKNVGLTQTLVKVQKENAQLIKQINSLQGETIEINSRYNNLKKRYIASNISNINRDTRTHAVKPHIVNGHVLQNPTITLSRLEGGDSFTPPRLSGGRGSSNINVRPSTSRSTSDTDLERRINPTIVLTRAEGATSPRSSRTDHINISMRGHLRDPNDSIKCKISKGQGRDATDPGSSDEEEELEEEEVDRDESSVHGLSTIEEWEEEIQSSPSSSSLRSPQRRYLNGRLQDVRIYLNQLPSSCAEQFRSSGNISISVSPPERRSSFFRRPSSLLCELNETEADNEGTVVDGNRTLENSRKEAASPRMPNLSPSFRYSTAERSAENGHDSSDSDTLRHPSHISSPDVATPSTSSLSQNDTNNLSSDTVKGKEKKKVAQVVLDRLSLERSRRSESPLKKIGDIVNMPPITNSSEMTTRYRSGKKSIEHAENVNPKDKIKKNNEKSGRKKRKNIDSPTKRTGNLRKESSEPKGSVSPRKSSTGRPKRVARPKDMKEPSLMK
ncbi:hypothetical protein NQ318_004822 [Aromia moschata]|uniref:Shugoshin C-terminal domain-containing protein n=1 Tax=Aromia moschata TaxID=1265417 RepID=A0AAV8YZR3_9CUCU|nr:hypothetical protein NQ318_004822 [Aromia moschata]